MSVQQDEGDPSHGAFDQLSRPFPNIPVVHVPPDRGHRRHGGEGIQNPRIPHVTRVEDTIDLLEGGEDLVPQESVGVADHPDPDDGCLPSGCPFPGERAIVARGRTGAARGCARRMGGSLETAGGVAP